MTPARLQYLTDNENESWVADSRYTTRANDNRTRPCTFSWLCRVMMQSGQTQDQMLTISTDVYKTQKSIIIKHTTQSGIIYSRKCSPPPLQFQSEATPAKVRRCRDTWRAFDRNTGIITATTESTVRETLAAAHKGNRVPVSDIPKRIKDKITEAVVNRSVIPSSPDGCHSLIVVPPTVPVNWTCLVCRYCGCPYTNDYRMKAALVTFYESEHYCSPSHDLLAKAEQGGYVVVKHADIVETVQHAQEVLTTHLSQLYKVAVGLVTASKKLIGDAPYFVMSRQSVEQLNRDLTFPAITDCVVKPVEGAKQRANDTHHAGQTASDPSTAQGNSVECSEQEARSVADLVRVVMRELNLRACRFTVGGLSTGETEIEVFPVTFEQIERVYVAGLDSANE